MKRHCLASVLLEPLRDSFIWKKTVTMIPTNLVLKISYKIAFISLLYTRRLQKQGLTFRGVGGSRLVTRHISVFYL